MAVAWLRMLALNSSLIILRNTKDGETCRLHQISLLFEKVCIWIANGNIFRVVFCLQSHFICWKPGTSWCWTYLLRSHHTEHGIILLSFGIYMNALVTYTDRLQNVSVTIVCRMRWPIVAKPRPRTRVLKHFWLALHWPCIDNIPAGLVCPISDRGQAFWVALVQLPWRVLYARMHRIKGQYASMGHRGDHPCFHAVPLPLKNNQECTKYLVKHFASVWSLADDQGSLSAFVFCVRLLKRQTSNCVTSGRKTLPMILSWGTI